MRAALLTVALAMALLSASAAQFSFETDTPGTLPAGFAQHLTGAGGSACWRVREAHDAPSGKLVLVQEDAQTNSYRFPHCVLDRFNGTDVELTVRFKTLSGEKDQAAGLIWRWQDSQNYYVVRANALENNVVLYKMENGKRADLKPVGAPGEAYGVKAAVKFNQWHALRLAAKGSRFSVYLDGNHLFDVEDKTFTGPGKVGLWTKADSVTAFDDLIVAAPGAGGP